MTWPQMLLSLAAVVVSASGAVSWVNDGHIRASREGTLPTEQAPVAVALTLVVMALMSVAAVLAVAAAIV